MDAAALLLRAAQSTWSISFLLFFVQLGRSRTVDAATLYSADCTQLGQSFTYSNPASSYFPSYRTCVPVTCQRVSNAAAIPPTPSPPTDVPPSYAFSAAKMITGQFGYKDYCEQTASVTSYPDKCSRAALTSHFMTSANLDKGHLESGLRLMYCNDQFLVIMTANIPNHTDGLEDNPHPPGSGFTSTGAATNDYKTMTVTRSHVLQTSIYKIPLTPIDLGVSSVENNKGRFAETFVATTTSSISNSNSISAQAYVTQGSKVLTLSTANSFVAVGMTVSGQGIDAGVVVTQVSSGGSVTLSRAASGSTNPSPSSYQFNNPVVSFAPEASGHVHAGYVICQGTGPPCTAAIATLSACDSAEVVGGTDGQVASTTLTVSFTAWGTVCGGGSWTQTACSNTASGKYVYVSSTTSWVQLTTCTIYGGKGTCVLASAQTILAGSTLVIKSSTNGAVNCVLSAAPASTIQAGASFFGTHSAPQDLPAYTSNPAFYYPGIPIYGPLAISATGQVLYPNFDDNGYSSQEMCEVDKCNGHAGKGYDYHYHGDPYHSVAGVCLYGPKDYTDPAFGHPPLIGYSYDGYRVYGRHLNTTNIGYTTALDDCGGHSHGSGSFSEYHYHAQQILAKSSAGSTYSKIAGTGSPLFITTGGVYKCFRGDIGADRLFGASVPMSSRADYEDLKPCKDSQHFWRHDSLTQSDSGPLSSLEASFVDFVNNQGAGWTATAPTAAPVSTTATLTFTLTSVFSAAELNAQSSLKASIKNALAVLLEVPVSSVTDVSITAARARPFASVSASTSTSEQERERERRRMEAAARGEHDWREAQGEDISRALGYGLVVDTLRVDRRTTSSSVSVTATVVSPYSSSQLSSAYTANSAVFCSVFADAAASVGFTNALAFPTSAPNTAPTATSPTSSAAAATSLNNGSKTIIIGVIVGVGGCLLLAAGFFYLYSKQRKIDALTNTHVSMPIESAHKPGSRPGSDVTESQAQSVTLSEEGRLHDAL